LKLSRLSFVEIGKNGKPIKPVGALTDTARDVCDKNNTIIGTCAFRSPPRNGEVEIA